jgi:hypothetical protein
VAFDLIRNRLGIGIRGQVNADLKNHEGRRARRQKSNDIAWIRFEDSFGARRCQLLDLSRTGARVAIADANKIPDKFVFLSSKRGAGYPARVKWRRGTQIGIEFLRPIAEKQ